jgi:cell wall assembly regulator SMI1
MSNAPSIANSWQRIEHHARQNAPTMLAELRGGASTEDLDSLATLGLPLPDDLLDSLRRHDGEAETSWGNLLAGGGRLLSSKAIIEHHGMLAQALAGFDDDAGLVDDLEPAVGIGPVRALTWSKHWLPIIDMNGDVSWYLDFDPAPGGTVGQVIRVDPESGEWLVCAPSFAAFLADYADALERGEIEHEDGELAADECWPPLHALPRLAGWGANLDPVQQLVAAGRAEVALQLIDDGVAAAPPADGLLRLQAQAAIQGGDATAAIAALDALRGSADETVDDALLRAQALDQLDDSAARLTELSQAIQRWNDARLYFQRAQLWEQMVGQTPAGDDDAESMRWLASPPGQQHAATCLKRALSDYDAALAREDRLPWRFQRARCLLDSERWDEAEAACLDIIERLPASAASEAAQQAAMDTAEDYLQRARAREPEDGLDMLETMQSLLGDLGDDEDSRSLKAMLSKITDTAADLQAQEAAEREALDAEPDSTLRRARQVARELARMHADTPERFAAFDPAELDDADLRYHDSTRQTLEALGYRWLADVEPLRNTEASGQRVMVRTMLAADGHSLAAIWRLVGPFSAVEAVDLESSLDDGTILITNNTGAANPFDPPPQIDQHCLPIGTPVGHLHAAHQQRLRNAGQARMLADLDDVLAVQEQMRQLKRRHAASRGWVSDAELRSMLGGSYDELAGQIRLELDSLLSGQED